MFRIVCDPSSGIIELYLTEIRSGSLMFVVCLVGVWQRNFEPVLRVCTVHRNILEIFNKQYKYSVVNVHLVGKLKI